MAQSKQDMGSGNVRSLMLQLMIPAVVAQVVNLLYNIVDRIYIGHIAGITGLAPTCDPATPEELLQTFSLGGLREKFPDLVQIQWR